MTPALPPNANPELHEAVDLTAPDGRLNLAARGHSRTPLHRTGGLPGWGRNKRWEYWGIITPAHVIGLTISDLDYAAVHQCYVFDRSSGEQLELDRLVPLGRGVELPDTLPPITATATARDMEFRFTDEDNGTRLLTRIGGKKGSIEVDAFAEAGGDSLGVVVPWSMKRFQYTVKDLARPIAGTLTVDGVAHRIPAGRSWAVLDRGRGRWPYSKTWNWAAGSGLVSGVRTGLQLGGRWTVGSGATENALFLDGRMHYIPEELDWDYELAEPSRPWRVHGERVDATLTPFHVRRAVTNALIVAGDTTQAFGSWSGWAVDDSGTRHSVDGLLGWAEQAMNRW